MPRFASLRSRRAVEHGQKNTSTCSTRPERARARPAPDHAHPAPHQATPVSPARARAYKAILSLSRTPPHTLDHTGARDAGTTWRGAGRTGSGAGVLWRAQSASNTWRCSSAHVQKLAEIAYVRILAKIRRRPLPGTYGYLLYVSSKGR